MIYTHIYALFKIKMRKHDDKNILFIFKQPQYCITVHTFMYTSFKINNI